MHSRLVCGLEWLLRVYYVQIACWASEYAREQARGEMRTEEKWSTCLYSV